MVVLESLIVFGMSVKWWFISVIFFVLIVMLVLVLILILILFVVRVGVLLMLLLMNVMIWLFCCNFLIKVFLLFGSCLVKNILIFKFLVIFFMIIDWFLE